MPDPFLHRSLLFVPGDKKRALEKISALAADIFILDCEDGVAPDAKSTARGQIAELLKTDIDLSKIIVRINALDSPWGKEDLAAFKNAGILGLMLPKVETPEQVDEAAKHTPLPIWCNVETPVGVLRSSKLAQHPKVAALVAGCNDLARALKVKNDQERLGLMYSLGHMVLEARAYGKKVFDGTFIDFKDEDGLREQCEQGKALGFDGKTLIHPSQIDAANEIFGPSLEEISFARQIAEAYPVAEAQGKGVIHIDGRMIERLHYDEAVDLLKIASVIFPP